METISKYNLHGIDYVKLTELNDLIREMKKKAQAGTEPGYIEPDEGRRMSAMLALNHLGAVLNKEKTEEKLHERLEESRKVIDRAKDALSRAEKAVEAALDEDEEEEPQGSWIVYKPGKQRGDYLVFREWDNGEAILGKTGGMIFTYEGMAKHVAEKLGDGWTVVDVSQESVKKAERLLAAIFREDDEDDESWADGIGQAFSPD